MWVDYRGSHRMYVLFSLGPPVYHGVFERRSIHVTENSALWLDVALPGLIISICELCVCVCVCVCCVYVCVVCV